MSIVLTKAKIVTTLSGVSNIGFVDDREGRAEGLPWEDNTVLPLWVVKFAKNIKPEASSKAYLGAQLSGQSYHIKGYFPWNYEQNSELAWDTYLDLVQGAFSSTSPLGVACSKVDPVEVLENDFVMYKASSGLTLCHYSLLEVSVELWENSN